MEKDFSFKKSLGQNFLKDSNVINNIVKSANIDKNTLVIEVGPGGGALTKEIVPLSLFSLLYEADSRLEDNLKRLLSSLDNYLLKIGDFLDVDLKKEVSGYNYSNLYLIANLPYYITTPIIMKFILEDVLPDKIIVMVQKEVASRFAAKVGSKDYGSLTVFLNYYYDINKLFDVSRNCFVPKPNVDSTVICMNLKKNRREIRDMNVFKKLVKDSFRYKRKTIRNNLKGYDLDVIEEILKKKGYDLNSRAESMGLDVFIDIANNI